MDKTTKTIVGVIVAVLVVWGLYTVFMGMPANDTEVPIKQPEEVVTEPIKLGFIGPLAGDAAAYGEPAQQVITIAVDEINAAGGINNRDLEVIYEDGNCTGKDAANAAQKLINVDQVVAIIGGICSDESQAIAPIAEAAKVPVLSPGSTSPNLTGVSPFFFRNIPSDEGQGSALAEVAFATKNWRKIAIIAEKTDYATAFADSFETHYVSRGGEIVRENFAPETKDFRTPLTKLRAGGVDAILISVQAPAAGETILGQISELGWTPGLIGIDVLATSDIVAEKAELVEGLIGAEFVPDTNNPKLKNLISKYAEKHGGEIPFLTYAQTEYDAPFILAEGLKLTGEDGVALASWLRNLKDWVGASGETSFDANGDRAVGGHTPFMLQEGEHVPVTGLTDTPVELEEETTE